MLWELRGTEMEEEVSHLDFQRLDWQAEGADGKLWRNEMQGLFEETLRSPVGLWPSTGVENKRK